MGTPTVTNLKSMIRMNLIKNNKVTTEDVNLAEKLLVLTLEASKERLQKPNLRQLQVIS